MISIKAVLFNILISAASATYWLWIVIVYFQPLINVVVLSAADQRLGKNCLKETFIYCILFWYTFVVNSRCLQSSSSVALNNSIKRERVESMPTVLLSSCWQKWSTESLNSRTKQEKLSASAFSCSVLMASNFSRCVKRRRRSGFLFVVVSFVHLIFL